MSQKARKVFRIIERVTLFLLLVIFGLQIYSNLMKSNSFIVQHGVVVEYEETGDETIIVIYDIDKNKAYPCLISNDEFQEMCTANGCWPVFEAKLTGIRVRFTLQEYRYGDVDNDNFLYQLRSITIPPYERERIKEENLLPNN